MMCDNYRAVALLYTTYNIMANSLYVKLIPYAAEVIWEYQGGFQRGRSTVDQIFSETNIGKMLGTEYRCKWSIYWFSCGIWQCMEKGNMEWNALCRFPPQN
jgi:hypothetical protein